MGFFQGLIEKRDFSLQRWMNWLDSGESYQTASGIPVSQDGALMSTIVWGCIQVKSQDIAKVPLPVYRKLGNNGNKGREEAPYHNLYPIFKSRFNSITTAFSGRQALEYWICVNGNGYAIKEMNGNGRVSGLWILEANRVDVALGNDLINQVSENLISQWRNIRYIYTPKSGSPISFRPDQIFHVKGLTKNGITGISPVEAHCDSIGLSLAYRDHAGRMFKNGVRMPFVLQAPANIGAPKAKEIAESFNEQYGGLNAKGYYKTGVLYGGMEAKPVGFNNRDSEFLESQHFSVEDLCRIWRVSPHKVMDFLRATFSNITELNLSHVNDCLRPDQVQIEQSIESQLMTEGDIEAGYYVEHNNEALLKGTPKERAEVDQTLVRNGISTINEVRASRNWNPAENCDVNLVQKQMVPVGTTSSQAPQNPIQLKSNGHDKEHPFFTMDGTVYRIEPIGKLAKSDDEIEGEDNALSQ